MEATVAGFTGVVCRHLWLNGENRAAGQVRRARELFEVGNWVMRFILKVVMEWASFLA
jgi:hypothetical protein